MPKMLNPGGESLNPADLANPMMLPGPAGGLAALLPVLAAVIKGRRGKGLLKFPTPPRAAATLSEFGDDAWTRIRDALSVGRGPGPATMHPPPVRGKTVSIADGAYQRLVEATDELNKLMDIRTGDWPLPGSPRYEQYKAARLKYEQAQQVWDRMRGGK